MSGEGYGEGDGEVEAEGEVAAERVYQANGFGIVRVAVGVEGEEAVERRWGVGGRRHGCWKESDYEEGYIAGGIESAE